MSPTVDLTPAQLMEHLSAPLYPVKPLFFQLPSNASEDVFEQAKGFFGQGIIVARSEPAVYTSFAVSTEETPRRSWPLRLWR